MKWMRFDRREPVNGKGRAMRAEFVWTLAAALGVSASPASAAVIGYTISGTTLNDAYLFGRPDPVPAPLPFTISLSFNSPIAPTVDGRTSDLIPDDPEDRYTIGGATAYYLGLGGFVQTSVDFDTGLRKLVIGGDTIEDFGFKLRTGYQFVLLSSAFTADYTHPGVYTAGNALLNAQPSANYSFTQVIDPITGGDFRATYLHVDKLVITNSDFPPSDPLPVPVPGAFPLLGGALAILGLMSAGTRRVVSTGRLE